MMSERVLITGMGLMTPVGMDLPASRDAIQQGIDGFSPIRLFDASRYRCKKAGLILNLAASPGRSRASCMLEKVVREAMGQAGWDADMVRRSPVSVGTTNGGMFEGERFFRELQRPVPDPVLCREKAGGYPVSRQMQDLESYMEILGPKRVFSNACASGANGIGHAYQMIRHGIWDLALAGGYDALCELSFAGFDCVRSLSPTDCQPFGRNRNGLLLGEGAGILCLESESVARRRHANPLAEVLGYGATTDTYHHTQHNPNGKVAARSMMLALGDRKISPSKVGYVNAHGTGTTYNDAMETAAIEETFGSACPGLTVSSNKGAIGHLLGGAGSVEAILTAISLSEKWVPPTLHVEEVDPACRFHLARSTEAAPGLRYALTNSFGFGGACASLLLGALE